MHKGSFLYLILFIPVLGNALAAENGGYSSSRTYSQWSTQDQAQSKSLQKMIEELNGLIDKAEKDRAADRYFLRDLRDLARRYDNPWKNVILDDDFNDGDFSNNPTWTVASGEFKVDQYGLHTNTDIEVKTQPAESSSRKEDLGGALLGILLEELDKKDSKQQEPEAAQNTRPGELYLPVKISNAYSIQVELAVVRKEERIEWGVYQNKERSDGYYLAYLGGSRPEMELYRVSSRGRSTIEVKAAPKSIADGRNHVIEWNRNAYGDMTVSIDGKELFQTTDRGFRSDFNGFTLTNHGGEYSIRRIRINGT